MTKEQTRLLSYLSTFTQEQLMAPSYREIAEDLGYSSISQITRKVRRLAEYGMIEHFPNLGRSILITAKGKQFLEDNLSSCS